MAHNEVVNDQPGAECGEKTRSHNSEFENYHDGSPYSVVDWGLTERREVLYNNKSLRSIAPIIR